MVGSEPRLGPALPQRCAAQGSPQATPQQHGRPNALGQPRPWGLPLAMSLQISGSMSGSSSLAARSGPRMTSSTSTKTASVTSSVLIHPGHHTLPLLKPRHLVTFASSLFSSAGGASPCGTHAGRRAFCSPVLRSSIRSRVTWCRVLVTASALTRSSRLSLCLEESPAPSRMTHAPAAPSAQPPAAPSRAGAKPPELKTSPAEMAAPVRAPPSPQGSAPLATGAKASSTS